MMKVSKRKRISFISIVLVCISCLLVLCGCSDGSQKIILNGDFESGSGKNIKKWDIYDYNDDYDAGEASIISIVDSGYSGKGVKIESKSDNDARISQKIDVSPNSKYKVELYAKYENVTKGENDSGAGFNISSIDGSEKTGAISGSSDGWHIVTAYFTTSEGQIDTELSIGIGGYGAVSSGVVYLDNITVTKVNSIPEGESVFASKGDVDTSASLLMKSIFLLLTVSTLFFVVFVAFKSDKERGEKRLSLSEVNPSINKTDIKIILIMVLVATVMSFWDLGYMKSAYTFWKSEAAGEYIVAEFDKETTVSRVSQLNNIPGQGSYTVFYEDVESNEYVPVMKNEKEPLIIQNTEHTGFYIWDCYDVVPFKTKNIKLYVVKPGLAINEVGFFEKKSQGEYTLIPVSIGDVNYDAKLNEDANPKMIFDEQDVVETYKNYRNSTYFDEIYFPRTAYESLNGYDIYEVTHPPMGKNIMALGIAVFGMNPFGWRFMGTLFGVAMIPMLYLLALKIFKKRPYAFMASFLIMFDFMRLAQTRLATIDSYSAFFIICMYYFMYDYFTQKSYDKKSFKKSLIPLFWCGLMFGLGASTKWVCLYTGVGLAILFFLAKFLEFMDVSRGFVPRLTRKDWLKNNFLPTCLACVGFFVVIPLIIYVLSYIPYMASSDKNLFEIVLDNQKYMFEYHSGLVSEHSYGSPWYTWPYMQRPIYYYSGSLANLPSGVGSSIVSMGNPLVWWIGFVCIFPSIYFAIKKRDKGILIAFVGYAVQFFPWILVTRVCFIYHYFTAVPFIILMIVYVAKNLVEDKIINKKILWIYLALVLVLFIMFYPVLTAREVSREYIDSLRWFSTWSF